MHDGWRSLGHDRLPVLWRGRLGWLGTEPLKPGLCACVPRRGMRTALDRFRPVAPDMHDFNHSALAAAEITFPRRTVDETLFTRRGLCPLPFPGGEDAICF